MHDLNQLKNYYKIPKFRKKNDQIKSLCIEYDIDIDKYTSLLNRNSDEIYAKICFLCDDGFKEGYNDEIKNQLQLFVNDELNEIFFMSDMNMRIKYDISLKELLDKYVLCLDRAKGVA